MGFRLIIDAEGRHTEYGDGASYNFNPSGLLVIVDDHGTRHTLSPQAWFSVEDRPRGGGGF
jgi:hypothetical protein